MQEAGDGLAERVLGEAAGVLEERERRKVQAVREEDEGEGEGEKGKQIVVMDALRGLGRVLNSGAGAPSTDAAERGGKQKQGRVGR